MASRKKAASRKDGLEAAFRRELKVPIARAFVPVDLLRDKRSRNPVLVPNGKGVSVARLACSDASVHLLPENTAGVAVAVVLFADDSVTWVASRDLVDAAGSAMTEEETEAVAVWQRLVKEEGVVFGMAGPPGTKVVWQYSSASFVTSEAMNNDVGITLTVYAPPMFTFELDPTCLGRRGLFFRALDRFTSGDQIVALPKVSDDVKAMLFACGLVESEPGAFGWPELSQTQRLCLCIQMAYSGWCLAKKSETVVYGQKIATLISQLMELERTFSHSASLSDAVVPVVTAPGPSPPQMRSSTSPVPPTVAVVAAAPVASPPPTVPSWAAPINNAMRDEWTVTNMPLSYPANTAPCVAMPEQTILHRKLINMTMFGSPLAGAAPLKEEALLLQLAQGVLETANLQKGATADVKLLIESLEQCGRSVGVLPSDLIAWRFEAFVYSLLGRLRAAPFEARPELAVISRLLRNATACLYVRNMAETLLQHGALDSTVLGRFCPFDLVRVANSKYATAQEAVEKGLKVMQVRGVRLDKVYEIVPRSSVVNTTPLGGKKAGSTWLWLWHRVRRSEVLSLLWNGPAGLSQVSPYMWGGGLYFGDDLSERLGDADPEEREYLLMARIEVTPQTRFQVVDAMLPEDESLTRLYDLDTVLVVRGRFGISPNIKVANEVPGSNMIGDMTFTQLASCQRAGLFVVRDPAQVEFKLLLRFEHIQSTVPSVAPSVVQSTIPPVASSAEKPTEKEREAALKKKKSEATGDKSGQQSTAESPQKKAAQKPATAEVPKLESFKKDVDHKKPVAAATGETATTVKRAAFTAVVVEEAPAKRIAKEEDEKNPQPKPQPPQQLKQSPLQPQPPQQVLQKHATPPSPALPPVPPLTSPVLSQPKSPRPPARAALPSPTGSFKPQISTKLPPAPVLASSGKSSASAFAQRVQHSEERPNRTLPPMPAPPLPSTPLPLSMGTAPSVAVAPAAKKPPADLGKLLTAIQQVKEAKRATEFESPPRDSDAAVPEEDVDYGDLLTDTSAPVPSLFVSAPPVRIDQPQQQQQLPPQSRHSDHHGERHRSNRGRSRSRSRSRSPGASSRRGHRHESAEKSSRRSRSRSRSPLPPEARGSRGRESEEERRRKKQKKKEKKSKKSKKSKKE